MSDLISRQDAIDIANSDGAYGYISADELARMPSARPTEIATAYTNGYVEGAVNEALKARPTGEWIDKEIPCNPYPPIFCIECSECGYRVGRETFLENTFNFCPSCGAQMLRGDSDV